MSTSEVLIDGVLYAPVSQAHIAIPAIEDAIVGQWAGADWRTDYPRANTYLKVVVGDSFTDDEGETVEEFAARLLDAAERYNLPGGTDPSEVL